MAKICVTSLGVPPPWLQVMKAVNHPNQRIRLGVSETLLCMDPVSLRLLKYQEMEGGGKAASIVKVDAAFFSERDNIQVCWQRERERE